MSHEDDLSGLSDYLSAFSGLGAAPTSLGGYGFDAGRHRQELSYLGGTGFAAATGAGWDAEAIGRKPPAALLKTKFNCQQRCTERFNEWTPYAIQDISRDLIAVRAMKGPPSKVWSKVAAGWKVYATTFKVYPEAEQASGGTYSSEFVWLNKLARAKLAKDAAAAGPAAQPSASKPVTSSTPATPKPTTKEYVSTTPVIQDILIRLGWRGKLTTQGPVQKVLTDGSYGPTTVANWAQSATKRKLDPAIRKVAADGSTVAVNESTFYALKALADQLVPPTAAKPMPTGTSMFTRSPSSIAIITSQRLGEVLGRLVSAKSSGQADLKTVYQQVTKDRKLASDIEAESASRIAVVKTSWDALVKEYDSKAPAPPPLAPSEKQNVEAAMGQIAKKATNTTQASTLKNVFNVAIAAGTIKREPFKGDSWTTDYVDLLLKILKPADAIWEKAWRQLLVKGKLVSGDLKSVKLTPEVSSALKKIEADYLASKKAEVQTFQGYTKANTAKLIESVNALNVSDKAFDPSKGAQELADALKTFLDSTKQGVVGDLVKVQDKTKDVFVKDDVLVKLAAATKAAGDRAKATDSYRKSMVSEALKASNDTVTVDQIQQTFAAALMVGKVSGEEKKLYEAVKLNGAFDAATKAAYTFIAKRLTLGTEIQQFEKLVREQLGPRFKAAMVQEVYNKTWSEFLNQAVGKKDGKVAVRTLPAIGQKIRNDSGEYRKVKGDQNVAREKEAEFKKTMAEAVKKSNVIISLFDVQMALLESEARKEVKAAGVKTTGRGDEPTKTSLFNLVGASIFGTKHKERWDWDKYLDDVGIRVESPSSVKKGWTGATYVGLPQAAANLLSDRAAAWMEKRGFPDGYTNLAPLPLSNQELRLRFDKPTVITVKRPAPKKDKEVVFDTQKEKKVAADKRKKAEAKKRAAEEKKKRAAAKKKAAAEAKKKAAEARRKAEAAKQKAAEQPSNNTAQQEAKAAETEAKTAELDSKVADTAATQAAVDATASSIESTIAEREAAQAEVATGTTSAGGGQATVGPITIAPQITVPGGSGAEPSPLPEPAPAPEPAPEPTPVTPTEAGMGGGMGLAFLGGLGVLALLFGDKKDTKKAASADARYKKRYATRGGRYGRSR